MLAGGGVREEPVDDVGVVGAVVAHFGDGAVAEIEVAGEAGGGVEVRGGDPEVVVAEEIGEGLARGTCGLALGSVGSSAL